MARIDLGGSRPSKRSWACVAAAAALAAWGSGPASAVPVVTTDSGPTLAVSSSDLLHFQSPLAAPGTTLLGQTSFSTTTPLPRRLIATDGEFGPVGNGNNTTERYDISNNAVIEYSLPLAASPGGFTVTGIDLFQSWSDDGRDRQGPLSISYSLVSDPTTFITYITDVTYDPPGPNNTLGSKVSITDSTGVIATNVARVRIDYGTVENNMVAGREIDVFGTKATGEAYVPPQIIGTANHDVFSVSNTDLIHGLTPTVTGGSIAGGVESLTDGEFGPAGGGSSSASHQAHISSGRTLTYQLDLLAAPLGYDISSIESFAAWQDNGREGQTYIVEFAFASDLSEFFRLTDVHFNPIDTSGINPDATHVQVLPGIGSFLAENVGAIRFLFPTVENNGVGYREFDVFGTPSQPPASGDNGTVIPEPASLGLLALGALGLTVRRRRA